MSPSVQGSPRNEAYAASEAALTSLLQGCAVEFARHAVYLAGGAGGFQTGDTIVVDGGHSIF